MQKIFGLGLLALGCVSQAADTPIQMPSKKELFARLSTGYRNPSRLSKGLLEHFFETRELHKQLAGKSIAPSAIADQIDLEIIEYSEKNRIHHRVKAATMTLLKKEVYDVVFSDHPAALIYLEETQKAANYIRSNP